MTKEQVYDAEISPMMAQILAICKQHNIAMVASFDIGDEMLCTSALLTDEYDPPASFVEALDVIRPPERKTLHYRIDHEDGTTELGAIPL